MGRISMPQGKGSQLHNRRDYEKIGRSMPENIDQSKSSENITLVDRDLREAYKEIFGNALKEYNDKQKRSDRRIEDYYDHIQKSKNGEKLFYEDVVQWGSKDDFINNPEMRKKALDALVEYVIGFEQRNPNLKLIGAYIHMDEASPHLHLDYVPVATGYSRGMTVRNSLDKAMKEMGFQPVKESRKNNATKLWKENERAVFGEICRNHGLEVEAERKARGSLSVEEYKELRDEILGELELEAAELAQTVSDLKEDISTLQTQKTALEVEKTALEGEVSGLRQTYEWLKEKIAEFAATAAGKLLRVQERLDRTLQQLPANIVNEFKQAWSRTKDVNLEQVHEKQKGRDENER